jgi:NADH-quinone oxidoreductase subunit N
MITLVILAITALVTLFLGVFGVKKLLVPTTIGGLIVAFATNYLDWGTNAEFFNKMITLDNYSVAFSGLLIILTFFVVWLSSYHLKKSGFFTPDIYALYLFALVGALVLTSFTNLTMFFIGLETLSVSLYVLAGSRKDNLASNESSLKYFLLGSFSTGFLLFGIALVYGISGSFNLAEIHQYVAANSNNIPMPFLVGLIMILVALTFKVSAVPFHFWAPDVYTGAPTHITAFMATVAKTASFAAFFRLMDLAFYEMLPDWFHTIWILAVASMFIGNLIAYAQKSAKRTLAYSGISNAGYALVAILYLSNAGASTIFYYLAAYSVASLLAFSIIMVIEKTEGINEEVDLIHGDEVKAGSSHIIKFRGLAKRNLFLAVAFILAMFSLAGIPPFAGFFAKYFLLANAFNQGYFWIVGIVLLNSAIGLGYYIGLGSNSFKYRDNEEFTPIKLRPTYALLISLLLIIVLLMGIFPSPIISLLM